MKDNKSLYISIVLALVACLVVVFLRLFSVADLWFQMFAAILGVIITAIITQVLFLTSSMRHPNFRSCSNPLGKGVV